jgi:hypothetical protein
VTGQALWVTQHAYRRTELSNITILIGSFGPPLSSLPDACLDSGQLLRRVSLTVLRMRVWTE